MTRSRSVWVWGLAAIVGSLAGGEGGAEAQSPPAPHTILSVAPRSGATTGDGCSATAFLRPGAVRLNRVGASWHVVLSGGGSGICTTPSSAQRVANAVVVCDLTVATLTDAIQLKADALGPTGVISCYGPVTLRGTTFEITLDLTAPLVAPSAFSTMST